MPKRDALSLGLLWVLASAVFWNGLGGHFVGDDFPLIVNNTNLPRLKFHSILGRAAGAIQSSGFPWLSPNRHGSRLSSDVDDLAVDEVLQMIVVRVADGARGEAELLSGLV
jgi:hypothetical protein